MKQDLGQWFPSMAQIRITQRVLEMQILWPYLQINSLGKDLEMNVLKTTGSLYTAGGDIK